MPDVGKGRPRCGARGVFPLIVRALRQVGLLPKNQGINYILLTYVFPQVFFVGMLTLV